MTSIDTVEMCMLATPRVILAGARTNQHYPDSGFSEIKICARNLNATCVCSRGSVSKIRSECLECKNISDLDRHLLQCDVIANPSHLMESQEGGMGRA